MSVCLYEGTSVMGVPFWSVLQWRSCGGVQSNRWDQTALRPPRVPPTHKCIQTLTLYRTHTPHWRPYKGQLPVPANIQDWTNYFPVISYPMGSGQQKERGGDHNFTELH